MFSKNGLATCNWQLIANFDAMNGGSKNLEQTALALIVQAIAFRASRLLWFLADLFIYDTVQKLKPGSTFSLTLLKKIFSWLSGQSTDKYLINETNQV